ncbi:MAG: O-antigen ligase family protein [bacterium]
MTDRFNKIAMGLLLIWLPLAFYYRAAEGFTLSKEFVGLLALGWLIGVIFLSGALGLWRLTLLRVSGIFLLWMIADAACVAPVKLEALAGSVHLILMVGTLWAVVFLCSRGLSYERLLHYALGAGFLMAIYGIVQALGGDATHWTTHFSSRAFSTLGNPDYLGGHLAALVPLAAVLTLRSETRRGWMSYRLIGMVLLACLLMTRVWGAGLAMVGAFLFIGFSFWLPWGQELFKRNRRAVLGFLGIVVVAGGIWAVWKGGFFSWTTSKISVEQRESIYKTSWEIVKAHPLLGIGLGQLGVVYPTYQYKPYAPADYSDHPYIYTEHVHDEFLQLWVEGGAVGLLLFLAVLIAFGMAVRKTLSDAQTSQQDRELLLGACAAGTALLIQALSNFPFQVPSTAVLFGLFLAAPLALRSSPKAPTLPRVSPSRAWILGLLLLIGAGVGVRAVGASIAYRNTAGETLLGHGPQAARYANRLTGLAPYDAKAWSCAAHAFQLAGQGDNAYQAFQRSLDLNPDGVENLMAQADLKAKADQLPQALVLAQKALALAPNYVGPIWVEAYCQYQLKQYAPAAESFQTFLSYAPMSPDAWVGLGVCDIHLGKKKEAIAAWQKAHQLAPQNAQVIGFLKGVGVKP